MLQVLGEYPDLPASRLYEMVRERGYDGARDDFRAIVARHQSVRHDRVRRAVTVVASATTVRVLDGHDVVATHPRSWSKGRQVEDAAHVAALAAKKAEARRNAHSARSSGTRAGPNSSGVDRLRARAEAVAWTAFKDFRGLLEASM